jgi:hypothetical protein
LEIGGTIPGSNARLSRRFVLHFDKRTVITIVKQERMKMIAAIEDMAVLFVRICRQLRKGTKGMEESWSILFVQPLTLRPRPDNAGPDRYHFCMSAGMIHRFVLKGVRMEQINSLPFSLRSRG